MCGGSRPTPAPPAPRPEPIIQRASEEGVTEVKNPEKLQKKRKKKSSTSRLQIPLATGRSGLSIPNG